jgi:hypothetical protein
MRYISPRRVVLLAALLLLIAPWASAAPRHGNAQPVRISGIPDVLSLAWSYITGGWMKEGCQIDPSGRCLPTSAPVSSPLNSADLGCQIEPTGHCLPASSLKASRRTNRRHSSVLPTKEGCHIDPSGRCVP